MSDSDQTLPSDPDTEAAVLSAMIGNPEMVSEYAGLLSAADFYSGGNRSVFVALTELHAAGKPVDLPAVVAESRGRGLLEKAGGAAGVALLVDVPPAVVPEFYAGKLRDMTTRRRMWKFGHAFQKAALQADQPAGEALARITNLVQSVSADATPNTYTSAQALMLDQGDRIDALFQNPGRVAGIGTGFYDLDRMTGGLQRSDLIIVAGRPSMGKTALATCIARNAARVGFPVGIFSLEMSKAQLSDRLVSAASGVNLAKFRTGRFDAGNYEAIAAAQSEIARLPLFIDDTGGIHINELRRRARVMKTKEGIAVFVVDYLGLASGDAKNGRVEEVSSVSRGLKAMAKELDAAVIALSQLNRSCEARDNKRPVLSDLRDSGAIEQDADVVAFVYRDEVYRKDSGTRGRPRSTWRNSETALWYGPAEVFSGRRAFRQPFAAIGRYPEENESTK